jgi:hypothetical protein
VLIVLNILSNIALFASAFLGIEMGNTPPKTNRAKWLYRILFFAFASTSIVTTVIIDKRNEDEKHQQELRASTTEAHLTNQLSAADGKLDAITQFMGLVYQQGGGLNDKAAKAYGLMAQAVIRLAEGAKNPVSGNRELPPAEQKALESSLKMPPALSRGVVGLVRILYAANDEEAFRLARQLQKTFAAAGWRLMDEPREFSPPNGPNTTPNPTGITVSTLGGGMSDSQGRFIREAFRSVGILTPGYLYDPIDRSFAVVQVKVWSHN